MWVPWEEPRIRCCGIIQAARAWAISGRCVCAVAGVCSKRKLGCSRGPRFGLSCSRLRSVSAESGRTVIVITDNAKYHHAKLHAVWRQEQAPTFALDYLPPYSPELNPIERVWKRTRRNCVHNVYFPTLQTLVDRVNQQFLGWSEPNDELTRLCRI